MKHWKLWLLLMFNIAIVIAQELGWKSFFTLTSAITLAANASSAESSKSPNFELKRKNKDCPYDKLLFNATEKYQDKLSENLCIQLRKTKRIKLLEMYTAEQLFFTLAKLKIHFWVKEKKRWLWKIYYHKLCTFKNFNDFQNGIKTRNDFAHCSPYRSAY